MLSAKFSVINLSCQNESEGQSLSPTALGSFLYLMSHQQKVPFWEGKLLMTGQEQLHEHEQALLSGRGVPIQGRRNTYQERGPRGERLHPVGEFLPGAYAVTMHDATAARRDAE